MAGTVLVLLDVLACPLPSLSHRTTSGQVDSISAMRLLKRITLPSCRGDGVRVVAKTSPTVRHRNFSPRLTEGIRRLTLSTRAAFRCAGKQSRHLNSVL